ncbi:MAG: sigma-70 family RNA polymerase sigma factor [Polyangiaceae bacterium]
MILRLLKRTASSPPPPESGSAADQLVSDEETDLRPTNPQETRELLRRVTPRVGRAVYATLGAGHADADDVIQLSLIAFIQALPAFRGECSPESYACTIAVRTALAARRRAAVSRARCGGDIEPDDMVSSAASPRDEVASSQRREIFRVLMDQLPDAQAETFLLRVVLGWSLDEVAEATNVPLNTVRSRIRLAKEALRCRIEADPSLAEALEVDT